MHQQEPITEAMAEQEHLLLFQEFQLPMLVVVAAVVAIAQQS